MSLISELIIQGTRAGAGGVGSALGGGVASALGAGGGGGGKYAPQPALYKPGEVDAALAANEVNPLDVLARSATPAPGAGAAIGGAAGAAINAMPTDVSDVVVQGKKTPVQEVPSLSPIIPDASFKPTDSSPAGLVPYVGEPPAPIDESGGKTSILDSVNPLDAAALGLAGASLFAPSGLKPPVDASGATIPEDKGLLDILNVKPTDLLGAGILGAGLLAGGAGGGGSAEDALKGVADKASNLSDRLGNVVSAGFAGNIGGRGLNSINHMVRRAQAAIRQRYASLGMTGSTAETEDLSAAVEAGVDLQFKVGQQMAQAGLTAIAALTGQSAAIYAQLLNAQTQRDTALGNALASFAGAVVS